VTQVVKTVVETTPPPKHTTGPASSGNSGGGGIKVPGDLVGKKLNDVEDELDSAGISYSTEGGNVFLRGDWGVCSTTPSAGTSVSGAVLLHIGHFSCGA
jgi:hypothetical protein